MVSKISLHYSIAFVPLPGLIACKIGPAVLVVDLQTIIMIDERTFVRFNMLSMCNVAMPGALNH